MDARRALSDTQSQIGMLGNFSQGSVNALQSELDFANASMPATQMASDLAGLVGQGAMLYGLTKRPPAPSNVPMDVETGLPQSFNISRRPAQWSF
jgi:hypothetical protein